MSLEKQHLEDCKRELAELQLVAVVEAEQDGLYDNAESHVAEAHHDDKRDLAISIVALETFVGEYESFLATRL